MPQSQPDLKQALERLFARPRRREVAGHALFRATAQDAGAVPVVAGSPTVRPSRPQPAWRARLAAVRQAFPSRRSPAIVGVDLGTSAIKIVRVEPSEGSPRVTAVVCEEYPQGVEGQAQERLLQERLQELKREGVLTGRLILGVADPRTIVELVTVPKMPPADLQRAVAWEAKQRFAAETASSCVRHVVVGETRAGDQQAQYEILLVASAREELASQWRAFSERGFQVAAMEPAILAGVAACEAAGLWRPQEFVGLLDIGRRSSTLALVVRGGVRFVRSFTVAGDSITHSIMDYCQLDYATAETQKRALGLSPMALEEDRRVTGLETDLLVRVSHALGLYLERLAAEVEHSLRYVAYELGEVKDHRLDRLYLLGGGALLKNLGPFLSNRLNSPAQVADPFDHLAMSPAAQEVLRTHASGARLASALGLALHPVGR
jgi:type IV pilus assembly protein PilM